VCGKLSWKEKVDVIYAGMGNFFILVFWLIFVHAGSSSKEKYVFFYYSTEAFYRKCFFAEKQQTCRNSTATIA